MKPKQKLKSINLRGRKLKLPSFFPDATYGKVKSVSSADLVKIGIDGVVVNIYHLLKHNLIDEIARKGGIHKYMKLNKVIISDSGGFQIFSLIHRHPELGKINEKEAVFKLENGKKIHLTPEKCIQLQLKINSDIVMCLDDCRHAEDSRQEESVERTINWAERCKKEFLRLTKNMRDKPLLFAIIQGGENKKLRKYCAEKLIKIGFDGYAFGGFPIKQGKLLKEILKYTAKLMPQGLKYCMGVGKPKDIQVCCKLGYNLFDCVLPTRDARHKRVFLGNREINIRKKYFSSKAKIEGKTIKQLYDLFKINREEAVRLATLHNLREYSRLMQNLRG